MSDAARTMDAGALARARMAAELRALAAGVESGATRLAASSNDAEAIHDFRVALRKLRTVLRPAREVFGKRRAREVAEPLREYARITGAVRDDEVLHETLADLRLGAAARAALTAWSVRRSRIERARRAGAIRFVADAARLRAALDGVEALVARAPDHGELAVDLARRAIAGAEAEVEAHRHATELAGAAALHELRIRYKRLRYTAEVFAADVGEPAEIIAKRAAKMQKRLGEIHDIDVALLSIGRARTLPLVARRAVMGALVRARRALVAAIVADAAMVR